MYFLDRVQLWSLSYWIYKRQSQLIEKLNKNIKSLEILRPLQTRSHSRMTSCIFHYYNAPGRPAKDCSTRLKLRDHPPYGPCLLQLYDVPLCEAVLQCRYLLRVWDNECSIIPNEMWQKWFKDLPYFLK